MSLSWLTDWIPDGVGEAVSGVGTALGSAWEWGTKNPTVLSGIVGAGATALDYMNQPDTTATQDDIAYKEARTRAHNAGITEAAKRYPKGGYR